MGSGVKVNKKFSHREEAEEEEGRGRVQEYREAPRPLSPIF